MNRFSTLFLMSCWVMLLHAQPQRGWEVGPWLGAAHYFGDLNTTYEIDKPGLQGSVALRYNFNQRIAALFKASGMKLAGDDVKSPNAFEVDRNLSFYTTLLEFGGQIEFNFFPYKHGDKTRFSTPYLFVGAGGFHFNPLTKYNGSTVRLSILNTEGQDYKYSLWQPALIYGMGFKYDLSPSWSLNMELSGRALFTDYLDDVSGVYPQPNQLADHPLAYPLSNRSLGQVFEPGRQRGDRRETDGFGMLTIGLMYFINPLPCPKITK